MHQTSQSDIPRTCQDVVMIKYNYRDSKFECYIRVLYSSCRIDYLIHKDNCLQIYTHMFMLINTHTARPLMRDPLFNDQLGAEFREDLHKQL